MYNSANLSVTTVGIANLDIFMSFNHLVSFLALLYSDVIQTHVWGHLGFKSTLLTKNEMLVMINLKKKSITWYILHNNSIQFLIFTVKQL